MSSSPTALIEELSKLQQKFAMSGQDMLSYLQGLYFADYLGYWDYIKLDTLLTLQQPLTPFPDERIFIMYHQSTELYFNLMLSELEQIAFHPELSVKFFANRLGRISRYIDILIYSFDVMVHGMDMEQFNKFRMALLPASGFQSVQFRLIEVASTDFNNLCNLPKESAKPVAEAYEHIYWREGAIDLASGEPTLTLRKFEDKYKKRIIEFAVLYQGHHLFKKVEEMQAKGLLTPDLIEALKTFDANFNINWRLSHYRSAVRYLHKPNEDAAATGGTNWQKYLPPRFQRRMFFPFLWNQEEHENWGKAWVQKTLKEIGAEFAGATPAGQPS